MSCLKPTASKSKSTYYEPDDSREARSELLARGMTSASDMPLQGVAEISPLEEYIQQLTQNYVKSETPSTYQNAIDLASKTANESSDIMSLPEVQGLMSQIQQAGSKESNRLGRTLQLSGGAGTSKGRNILGQNVTDMQNQMASSMSSFLNAERDRKLTATGMMADLESSKTSDLLSKISTGSSISSLARQIEQQGLNAQYNQQMMPYTTLADILQSTLTNTTLSKSTGGTAATFPILNPLAAAMA